MHQAKEGFFCTIQLAAKVDLPPEKVFAILARPDSRNVFRSIDVRRPCPQIAPRCPAPHLDGMDCWRPAITSSG
jgi:hypothetical protein